MADGPDALTGIVAVSRETAERLAAFVALLKKWQPAENLIAPSTIDTLWRRHVADSAQLTALFPGSTWLDLGSGGGFPGVVVALLGAKHVHLVESNRRKCAFLRAAIRETVAPATVHEARVEEVLASWSEPVDRISARALAPLADLLALAEPATKMGVPAAFMKGVDYQREVDDARSGWEFDLTVHPSRTEKGAAILDIRNARRRANQGKTPQ